jgi:putative transposase
MERWNYKLKPNRQQSILMAEWLVTLRKHRNYCLREREIGWGTNNRDAQTEISYALGAYCEINTHLEVGAVCPLTCPIVKHGVMSASLTKTSKKLGLCWDSAGGIQSKRTTELRKENQWYSRIDSDVLQRNLAKLDAAFTGFWSHKRGFPAYRKASNFKTFEYKPGRCKFQNSKVYLQRLPADCGKVTPVKISIPEWVESRNLNLSELSSEKKGYQRDIKKTSGESSRL